MRSLSARRALPRPWLTPLPSGGPAVAGLQSPSIANCSAANREMVAELGADRIIDYGAGDFADDLREIDLVLDAVGGIVRQRSIAVLRPGGVLVTLDPAPSEPTLTRQIRVATVAVAPDGSRLLHLVHLLATGRLRVPIDRVFAMEEAASAHIHSQHGHARGKILISIDATMDRTIS